MGDKGLEVAEDSAVQTAETPRNAQEGVRQAADCILALRKVQARRALTLHFYSDDMH